MNPMYYSNDTNRNLNNNDTNRNLTNNDTINTFSHNPLNSNLSNYRPRQLPNSITRSAALQAGLHEWRGPPMDACSPPPLVIIPFSCGIPRLPNPSTPSPAIL